jgi:hypothetical protein
MGEAKDGGAVHVAYVRKESARGATYAAEQDSCKLAIRKASLGERR